jgi:hypothetical protein
LNKKAIPYTDGFFYSTMKKIKYVVCKPHHYLTPMAKKRVTLPKDFEELLKKNDLEELKAIFSKCELNARGGYGKQTALSFDDCSHELAKWLTEQGADLEATDTWGRTALHNRARFTQGNIKSLLELGANIHARDNYGDTALHKAASSHNNDNTLILLQHGANKDERNSAGLTPLELTLQQCRNIDISKTVAIATTYLNAGSEITAKMRDYVTEIGKNFEFHRAGFNKEYVDEVSNALDELYKLFQVEPVPKRALHDGKSPIVINAVEWRDQHQELWELLVPSSGAADTIQGEVIRIPGRISNELHGNGGGNWDNDFRKMGEAWLQFVTQGKTLSATEVTEARTFIKNLGQTEEQTDRLFELAVKWVLQNPQPLKCPDVNYKR